MFADKTDQRETKTNFSGIQEKASIHNLLIFLEECLACFPKEYEKEFGVAEWKDEREVTPLLTKYLDHQSRTDNKPYNFNHQEPQSTQASNTGKNREVDIAVIIYTKGYFDPKPFFVIECKWLKLPPSTSKQYVSGNTGGMERFKRELHGKELDSCAMIAFINEECFNYWLEKINTWISELFNNSDTLKWQKSDLLKIVKEIPIIARYISENKRSLDCITIHHLWLKMFP